MDCRQWVVAVSIDCRTGLGAEYPEKQPGNPVFPARVALLSLERIRLWADLASVKWRCWDSPRRYLLPAGPAQAWHPPHPYRRSDRSRPREHRFGQLDGRGPRTLSLGRSLLRHSRCVVGRQERSIDGASRPLWIDLQLFGCVVWPSWCLPGASS